MIPIVVVYGMTEASPTILRTPRSDVRHGSVGIVIPNTECKVVDVNTGKALPANQNGELWAKRTIKHVFFNMSTRQAKIKIN